MELFKIRFALQSDIPLIISLMKFYNMHHIPSPEMGELDHKFFLVAEYKEKIIGAAGFTFLSSDIGKSTLLAVHPEFLQLGIGKKLQVMRMEILSGFGCNKIITNADRPETILWYKKHFNYKEIGKISKLNSFGHKDIHEWTTLESDLKKISLKKKQPEKIIINFVPTGNVPRKKDNFNLPTTVKEIVKDVMSAAEKGASLIHLHARDTNENSVPDPKVFAEIITRIRERRSDLIICVTTSGRNYNEFDKRSAVLGLADSVKPDMASLTMGSLNFSKQAVSNDPATIVGLARKMLQKDIKPELELFEIGMIDYTKYLFRKGLLQLPLYSNLFLGSLGTMNASVKNPNFQLRSLPPYTYWTATGIGKSQDVVHKMAIRKGGGVRVGLEDNIYLDNDKTILATNDDLIDRVLEHAKTYNREIATPKEVRDWLGLT